MQTSFLFELKSDTIACASEVFKTTQALLDSLRCRRQRVIYSTSLKLGCNWLCCLVVKPMRFPLFQMNASICTSKAAGKRKDICMQRDAPGVVNYNLKRKSV